jgi:hypothetical protein
MTDDPVIRGFLDAARAAGVVVASPEVAAAWQHDSALEQMTVGSVAGHLFLVVRRVDKHLDEPEPTMPAGRALERYAWLRVEGAKGLDREDHRVVRDDGAYVGRWGPHDVATAYVDRVDRVATRLATRGPSVVAVGELVIDFREYLSTRIVELLVHADDLAVSVGMEPPELPTDAATIALELLLDSARALHGDLDVLRALTRPERTRPPVPSVF